MWKDMSTSGWISKDKRSGMRDMRGSHGTPGIKDVLEGRGINKSHRERTNYNKQH